MLKRLVIILVMILFSLNVFAVDDLGPRIIDFKFVSGEGSEEFVLSGGTVSIEVGIFESESGLDIEDVKADFSRISEDVGVESAGLCEEESARTWRCSWEEVLVSARGGNREVVFDIKDRAGNGLRGENIFNVVVRGLIEGEVDLWDIRTESVEPINLNFLVALDSFTVYVPLDLVRKNQRVEIEEFNVECRLSSGVMNAELKELPSEEYYLEVTLGGGRGFMTSNAVVDFITGRATSGSNEISFSCNSEIVQFRQTSQGIDYYSPNEVDSFDVIIGLRESYIIPIQDSVQEQTEIEGFLDLYGGYDYLKAIKDGGMSTCKTYTIVLEVFSALALLPPPIGPIFYPKWEQIADFWYGGIESTSGLEEPQPGAFRPSGRKKGVRDYCEAFTCSECGKFSRSEIATGSGIPLLTGEAIGEREYRDTYVTGGTVINATVINANQSSQIIGTDFTTKNELDPFKSIYASMQCKPVCISGIVFFFEKLRAIEEGRRKCVAMASRAGISSHHCGKWARAAYCTVATGELWELGIGGKLRGVLHHAYNEFYEKEIEDVVERWASGPLGTLLNVYIVYKDLKEIDKSFSDLKAGIGNFGDFDLGNMVEREIGSQVQDLSGSVPPQSAIT